MQVRLGTASILTFGAALAMSGILLAQATEPGSTAAPATQRTGDAAGSGLAGQWHLNKELSTLPQVGSSEEPSQPAGGGRRPGGGGGGGYGGGGGGGGYGGRGGFGGRGGRGGQGGGGTGGGAQLMSEDVLKMRALMRALAEPADLLTVLVSPSEVTTTDEHGTVLKFKTDGKKQEINFGPGALIDTKAKWDGDALSLELTAGSMKLTETYSVATESHMLVIAVQPASSKPTNGRLTVAPMKFVYGRGE